MPRNDPASPHCSSVRAEVGARAPYSDVDVNAEPVGQEDQFELHWLPLDQLAKADVQPAALKTVRLTVGNLVSINSGKP